MKLESMMATLLTNLTVAPGKPKDRNKPAEDDDKNNIFKWRFNQNMGGYCQSCGYHLVGRTHTSKTCC